MAFSFSIQLSSPSSLHLQTITGLRRWGTRISQPCNLWFFYSRGLGIRCLSFGGVSEHRISFEIWAGAQKYQICDHVITACCICFIGVGLTWLETNQSRASCCRISKLKAWTGQGSKLETSPQMVYMGEKYSYEKLLHALQPPSFKVWVDLFGLRATKSVICFGLKIFSWTYLLTGMSFFDTIL